jgi:hypothetical protein
VGPSAVEISYWSAADANVVRELQQAMATSLRKKATGQLRRAKDRGYRVGLLLDQVQDPTSPHPSNWLAMPTSIGQALRVALENEIEVLDAAWVRSGHDKVSRVHG